MGSYRGDMEGLGNAMGGKEGSRRSSLIDQRRRSSLNGVRRSSISFKRDLMLEFRLGAWIESVIQEKKDSKASFEDWLQDGRVLAKLMRSLAFNSVEEEQDELGYIKDEETARVRALIKQMREYGVQEELLFTQDDLQGKSGIPKVARCIQEVMKISEEDPSAQTW